MTISMREIQIFNNTDVVLSSFPRSGNTWTILLISDLIMRSQGLVPEYGWRLVGRAIVQKYEEEVRDSRIDLPFRIVKTHSGYKEQFKKAINIVRAPADCLVSYYYYKRFHGQTSDRVGIDEFSLTRLESWRTHILSWIEAHKKNNAKILFVTYEDLHQAPEVMLKNIGVFLGIEFDEDMVKAAIKNQSFQNLTTQETPQYDINNKFFRKGKVGESKKELSVEVLDTIHKELDGLYDEVRKLMYVQKKYLL